MDTKKVTLFILAAVAVSALSSCLGRHSPAAENPAGEYTAGETTAYDISAAASPADSSSPYEAVPEPTEPVKSPTALRLDSLGLVDLADYDPRIAVHLVYATPDNFVGEVMYDDLTEAYLLPEAAEKLSAAQDYLEESHPGYRIIVYDAARPMSVQRRMRRIAEATGKQLYVADPANGGGLHNYGAAVDVSVLDAQGMPLDMGTVYDHLGPEANIDDEKGLLARGILSQEQLDNRLLLCSVMRRAGFTTVTSEWWHFNHVSRPKARELYMLIDF
ncbi:MAG: M15 family metallopeptidase [Rikenellaceae bacterium]|nr:M15 family metallopeptidase [Rikenellaceae bacterium]